MASFHEVVSATNLLAVMLMVSSVLLADLISIITLGETAVLALMTVQLTAAALFIVLH